MKTQVFVLVPYDVGPEHIRGFVDSRLGPWRTLDDDTGRQARWDYLIGAPACAFHDPAAERRLPATVRPGLAGQICDRANLPHGVVPGAVVTPDGQWSDCHDFGWRFIDEPSDGNRAALAAWAAKYREIIDAFRDGWVVAVWAHS